MIKLIDILKESSNPHLYRIQGVLVTNTEKRTQGEILSDMRSIAGVTIVTPSDYHGGNDSPINNPSYTVELSIKIDPHPFKTFGKDQIKDIIQQMKRVVGVVRYTPKTSARQISETPLTISQEAFKFLKEEDADQLPAPIATLSFEEDPMGFIIQSYPTLANILTMLMTDVYKDYITGIYVLAPKPTTFKIVLHNNQPFYLTYLGNINRDTHTENDTENPSDENEPPAYEAEVSGKTYYLVAVGDRQRATLAIRDLLKLGQPINTKGPETETAAAEAPAEAPAEEKTPNQAEEETTES